MAVRPRPLLAVTFAALALGGCSFSRGAARAGVLVPPHSTTTTVPADDAAAASVPAASSLDVVRTAAALAPWHVTTSRTVARAEPREGAVPLALLLRGDTVAATDRTVTTDDVTWRRVTLRGRPAWVVDADLTAPD